jgi:hypothetical protein
VRQTQFENQHHLFNRRFASLAALLHQQPLNLAICAQFLKFCARF